MKRLALLCAFCVLSVAAYGSTTGLVLHVVNDNPQTPSITVTNLLGIDGTNVLVTTAYTNLPAGSTPTFADTVTTNGKTISHSMLFGMVPGSNGAAAVESATNSVTTLPLTSGTGTLTAASAHWVLALTGTNAYLKADLTTFPTNFACGFSLAIKGTNSVTFDNTTLTNTQSSLSTSTWNSVIFWKDYGQSIFVGR